MIATLTGRLRRKLEDRVILECGGIGYEVFLSPITHRQIEHVTAGPGGGDRALDLGGRQGQHRHVALACRETDHPAGVGHQQRGPRKLVLGVEILEDEHRRRLCLEQPPDAVVDQMDPRFERQIRARRDDAAAEHVDPAGDRLDQPVAGPDQAGVDAEDLEAMRPRWPREPRQECRS